MFGRKVDLTKDVGKKASGTGTNTGGLWIKRFAKGQTEMTVRPLTEPDQWATYGEVWDESRRRSWPLPDGGMLEEHQEVKNKYLAPMLDTENDRVMALLVPKAVFDSYAKRYARNGTVMNRDWVITREGSGLETTYELMEDLEIDRDLSKYVVPDLEDVLKDSFQHAVDEGWTTDPNAGTAPAAAPAAPAAEEAPAEAPAESETKAVNGMTADELTKLPLGQLRSMCRDQSINPSGLSKQEIIDAITGADAF